MALHITRKKGECVVVDLGDQGRLRIVVKNIHQHGEVRMAFEGPRRIPIYREELEAAQVISDGRDS